MSAIASTHGFHRHLGTPVATRRRRGVFRIIWDAIMLSGQRRAEHHIGRLLGQSGGHLTDDLERRITEHLTTNHNFRP